MKLRKDGFTEFCKIYDLIANKKKVQKCIFFLFFSGNKQHITVDNSYYVLYTVYSTEEVFPYAYHYQQFSDGSDL